MRQGKEPIPHKPGLRTAQSYLYQLFGRVPEERHWRPLETYLILLADHGMNASTFTARVIASTASDMCQRLDRGGWRAERARSMAGRRRRCWTC